MSEINMSVVDAGFVRADVRGPSRATADKPDQAEQTPRLVQRPEPVYPTEQCVMAPGFVHSAAVVQIGGAWTIACVACGGLMSGDAQMKMDLARRLLDLAAVEMGLQS